MPSYSARLDRLEAFAKGRGPCPGCGLSPGERRPVSVAYEDSPFEGDAERCPKCGTPPSVLLRVVYEPDIVGGGRDA
jgi:hypothetical protein